METFAQSAIDSEDVNNVLEPAQVDAIKSRQVVHDDNDLAIFSDEDDDSVTTTPNEDQESIEDIGQDRDNRSDGDIVSIAAKHALDDGGEMTKIAFIMDDNNILTYEKYERTELNLKSKAKLWRAEGETVEDLTLHVESVSANGKPPEGLDTEDGVSTHDYNDCDGCASEEFKYGTRECVDADVSCIIAGCSGCAWVCKSAGPYACGGCALVTCGATIHHCCDSVSTCNQCAMP